MDNTFNTVLPFVDFIYVLQLNDYDSDNYWNWVKKRFLKRGFQKVGRIDWTIKAKTLLGVSLGLYVIVALILSSLMNNFLWVLISIAATTYGIPLIVLAANLAFTPIDAWLKRDTITKAKIKLKRMEHCVVVAISGSFGKASTRLFSKSLIQNYAICHTPPQNHNTLYSLAQDILTNLKPDTTVYIVEVGEFYKGDLAKMHQMLRPDIVVLTSVGSQHISQLGSQIAIDQEFTEFMNLAADHKLLNGEDPGVVRVMANINKPNTRYFSYNLDLYHKKDALPEVLLPLHMQQNAAGAVCITETLGLKHEQIAKELKNLPHIERRMDISHHNGITIIDDTYNINPESAKAALDHLATYKGRKILVTGGIVDQGEHEAKANILFGTLIARVADHAVIAQNRLASYLKEGIHASQADVDISLSDSPDETPQILRQLLKAGDTVLLQNELTDLYWN